MNYFKILFCVAILMTIRASGQISPTVTSSTGNYSLTCTNPVIILTANSSFTAPVTYTWTSPQLTVVNGNSINATSSGVFSLTASSGTILETVTVSVVINNVQPTVSLTGSSGSITCTTPTILLTAMNTPTNVSYTWIEPSVGFGCTSSTCIAAQAGTYSVIVKDAVNGCQKTATINLTENRQYPMFSSIGLYTVACPNGTINLQPTLNSSTVNVTFQWKLPAGAVTSATNNLSLITNSQGEYTLIATNTTNGCSTSTLVSVFACVGIDEFNIEDAISLFPNPVQSELNIYSPSDEILTIQVTDVFSKVALTLKISQNKIDFSELNAGIYFVTIVTNKGKSKVKVVKL